MTSAHLIRILGHQVVVETYGAGDGNRHPTSETWENTKPGPLSGYCRKELNLQAEFLASVSKKC